MLYLDKNDPLDSMILQELSGQPVTFDVWLDAMDELDDGPDCEHLLQEKGLCREDALRSVAAYRADFRRRLSNRGLPVYDRFNLCRLLNEQAQADPSDDLLRIYCEILCAPGFLLDHEAEPDDAEDQADCEEQDIFQYLTLQEKQSELIQTLTQRKELIRKFEKITKENRSPKPVDCDTGRSCEILQCFMGLFDLPRKGSESILLDNLAHYIQVAGSSPGLKSIEPLLLFRLLTRRQSYMCCQQSFEARLPPLWKQDSNKFDEDNGRNFKQYWTNLRLFTDLCRIYKNDRTVDFPLCWYGLDRITVLGRFYRQEVPYLESGSEAIPFLPAIEELVEDSMFSCFEHGFEDNVLFTDSSLPYRKVEKFQSSSDPLIYHALEKLSDHMNSHAAELAEQFLQADASQVKSLCQSILEQAELEGKYHPKSSDQLALFLISINEGLMDLQQYFAEQHLIQAGYALSGEYQNSLNDI